MFVVRVPQGLKRQSAVAGAAALGKLGVLGTRGELSLFYYS